jgi:hypothetical protein
MLLAYAAGSERALRALAPCCCSTVELEDELAALLEQEKPLDLAAREAIVMGLFRRGRVSISKGCELPGLERIAFIRRANEPNVPV